MAEYRLVSYRDAAGNAKAGVLVNDRVLAPALLLKDDLQGGDTASVIGLLRQWDRVHPRLDAAAGEVAPGDGVPLADVVLDAPILYPGALFCAGANYWDHLQEMVEIAARTTGMTPTCCGAWTTRGTRCGRWTGASSP